MRFTDACLTELFQMSAVQIEELETKKELAAQLADLRGKYESIERQDSERRSAVEAKRHESRVVSQVFRFQQLRNDLNSMNEQMIARSKALALVSSSVVDERHSNVCSRKSSYL